MGCGNIGALYDLELSDKVWTHAKAFSKFEDLYFSVADTNNSLLNKVAEHYRVPTVELNESYDFSGFDIVSLTTPTPTHYSLLKRLIQCKVPVVICEKPVAANSDQITELVEFYQKSNTKVLVNYIRRFQPAFFDLKKHIALVRQAEQCTAIIVKYQRGFLNNASHAFDLLEFLFQEEISFEGFQMQSHVFDAFDYDPTITGTFSFGSVPVSIIGLPNSAFTVFELELFFNRQKVVICHSGNEIRFYNPELDNPALIENFEARINNILSEYMLPVVHFGRELVQHPSMKDNFLQAASLNKRMLTLLSQIK